MQNEKITMVCREDLYWTQVPCVGLGFLFCIVFVCFLDLFDQTHHKKTVLLSNVIKM